MYYKEIPYNIILDQCLYRCFSLPLPLGVFHYHFLDIFI